MTFYWGPLKAVLFQKGHAERVLKEVFYLLKTFRNVFFCDDFWKISNWRSVKDLFYSCGRFSISGEGRHTYKQWRHTHYKRHLWKTFERHYFNGRFAECMKFRKQQWSLIYIRSLMKGLFIEGGRKILYLWKTCYKISNFRTTVEDYGSPEIIGVEIIL